MTYYYIGGVLAPSKVFSVFTYVTMIKLPLTNFVPKVLQFVSECLISVKRIEEFLNTENNSEKRDEMKDLAFLNNQNDTDLIAAIVDGSFAWKTDPVLSDINLNLKKRELVAICGPVGAGKSSLLNVLLHDLSLIGGEFAMSTSKIAYVSQSAWILSGTIKENILFGQPYNESKFKSVVKTCSLEADFKLFPNAENTILGERGVTLSGGQRARVSLARAIYYDADLYLLDDPLSAVDTKVGRQLFENCIKKTLANKVIIN
jgi:ATP-binding cassette subfamily C (CFTR/MRP) protein 4